MDLFSRIHEGQVCNFSKQAQLEQPTRPVEVILEIHQLLIREVDDDKFTMTIDLDFSTLWKDTRIISLANETKVVQVLIFIAVAEHFYNMFKYFLAQVLPKEYFEKMWIPDLYLFGVKEVKLNAFLDDYTSSISLCCTQQFKGLSINDVTFLGGRGSAKK